MASRAFAYSPEPQPTEVTRAMLLVEESTRPRIVTNFPPTPVFELETGLRAGIKLKFTPDKRGEFPATVAQAVEEVRLFEQLPAGWDSHNAAPLDDRAVVAAFELIIHGESRCDAPVRLVPLPDGGLGLRWENELAELEVDVSPNGTCEATFDGPGVEVPVELVTGSTLADAKELISRHASPR